MKGPHFVYPSSVHGHLALIPLLTAVDNTSMNIHMQVVCVDRCFQFFWCKHRSGTAGLCGDSLHVVIGGTTEPSSTMALHANINPCSFLGAQNLLCPWHLLPWHVTLNPYHILPDKRSVSLITKIPSSAFSLHPVALTQTRDPQFTEYRPLPREMERNKRLNTW